jgi:antitoxin MazE
MRSVVRKMGNSSGVIIPKPVLAALGARAGDAVEVTNEDDRIVIVPLRRTVRAGWADDAKAIAQAGDDALVWPEITNQEDDDLTW